jgi:prepilin-type N-terminal cleavage/methylation domain-containing protein
MARRTRGFTLIELLVVIVIISMLAGLLIPAVQAARARARLIQCTNNMAEITKAIQAYESSKQNLPASASLQATKPAPPAMGAQYVGWVPPLLGQLGRNDLYQLYITTGTAYNTGLPVRLELLICPSDTVGQPVTGLSYVVNGGRQDATGTNNIPLDWQANGMFFNRGFTADSSNTYPAVTTDTPYAAKNDGTSQTLLLSENIDAETWDTVIAGTPGADVDNGDWTQCFIWQASTTPTVAINRSVGGGTGQAYARPSANHGGLFGVTFCDGHHRTLSDDIDYTVFTLLMTPNGRKAMNPGTSNLSGSPWNTAVLNESDLDAH